MKDENKEIKEIKESEKLERGGQYELDDTVLEQAAGGGVKQWVDDALKRIKNDG